MCLYDVILIPVTFILNVWRGYEYFYIARLIMWGEIIAMYEGLFNYKSRRLLNICVYLVFTGWMVFRLWSIYDESWLMPYVFMPFNVIN